MRNRRLEVVVLLAVSARLVAACGEDHEVLGTRGSQGGAASGTGGAGAQGGSSVGGTSSGVGNGAGSGGTAVAGSPVTAGSTGHAGMGAPGGAGGTSGSAGASGRAAGNSSGGADDGGAGLGGGAGAPGGSGGTSGTSAVCPAGCDNTSPGSCPNDDVLWTCTSAYDHQQFLDGGCTDLATDIQRFCCPTDFFAACKPCADVTTLAECDSRLDCHAVFEDPGTCGCASPGCCAHFSRCADGYWAICGSATLECTVAEPFCESPYVVSYTATCYEGCVDSSHCQIH